MHRYDRKVRLNAFTLIELLVVIAIIAILAAILFPVFAQARAEARKINGVSMTKQVALAILMYNQDFDEAYPLAGWTCGTYNGVPNVCGTTQWPNVVAPYHKNAQIVADPADTSQTGNYFSNGKHTLIYNDLLAHNPIPVSGDAYGQVDWCGQNTGYCLPEAQEVGKSAATVVAPSDCVLITEGSCPWGAAGSQAIADAGANTGQPDWTGNQNPYSKWVHEQDMSQYQAVLITGTAYSGWNAYQGLPIHTGHTFTVYAYVDGHAKAVHVFDPSQANGPQHGNLLHSTLPFRKSYDPGQNAYPAAPETLGLGAGKAPYDNWQ